MSDYWSNLTERTDSLYTADDFESAAYRLIAEQVIYYTDLKSRVAYAIIEQYEKEMVKVLTPLGITLQVNRQLRYVAAIPKHAKTTSATIQQTLFALVLRGIYEENAQSGNLSDEGEVFCDLVDFSEKHRLMTQRELPGKVEFDNLMKTAKRWGIARRLDDGDHNILGSEGMDSGIAIRPGIVEVLGEAALLRLVLWQALPTSNSPLMNSTTDTLEADNDETA